MLDSLCQYGILVLGNQREGRMSKMITYKQLQELQQLKREKEAREQLEKTREIVLKLKKGA